MRASIFQINISSGGVPKLPVRSAQVTEAGIVGDAYNNTQLHGGQMRALCLYSLERIMEIQAEGHGIYPGSTGENLTLAGLNWNDIVPGVRLRLGSTVEVEVTQYTNPCQKIRESFADGDISRMAQDKNPGWSRVYARVVTPGVICIADKVIMVK